jgi:Domain of unknown function (DUF4251)
MHKLILNGGFFLLLVLMSCSSAQKTTTPTAPEIMQALTNQEYQFIASFVQPSGGRQRSITGTYTLKVSKATVVADLPYFGRAYTVTIGSTEGGVKFQSKDFQYSSAAGRRGAQEIRIKPNDISDTQELFLTVYDNGSANLRVNSINRAPIAYTGEIRPVKMQ